MSFDKSRLDPKHPVFGTMENLTGITPLGYKILVQIVEPEYIRKAKEAKVAIPDNALDRHMNATVVARVLQLGAGCYSEERFPEGPWVSPGDYVVMSAYTGTRVWSTVENCDLRLLNEDSIDAVTPDPELVQRGNA